MTPHDKALQAAKYQMNAPLRGSKLEPAIQTYLTTLLNSPEMVEKIGVALDELWVEGARVTMRDSAKAAIKAIKEEAGV